MTQPQSRASMLDHAAQPVHIIPYHDAATRRSCDTLGVCQYAHFDCQKVCARLAETEGPHAPGTASKPCVRAITAAENSDLRRAKRADDAGTFWLTSPGDLLAMAGPDEERYLGPWQTLIIFSALLAVFILAFVALGFTWGRVGDGAVQFFRTYAAFAGLG